MAKLQEYATVKVVYDGGRITVSKTSNLDEKGCVWVLAGALVVAWQKANAAGADLERILRELQRSGLGDVGR